MKLLLFGAGKRINYVINSIEKLSYTLVGIVDNNESLHGTEIHGLTVCGANIISDIEFDYVIITSEIYFGDIKEELIGKWNIDEAKIKHSTFVSLSGLLDFYKSNPQMLRPDMIETINYITERGYLTDFNAKFYDEGEIDTFDVFLDEAENLFYVFHDGKKMYFSSVFRNTDQVKKYYSALLKEQDVCSPHKYIDDCFSVNEGDVVLDGGVAEGNFALEVIEKVKHIILVEADKEWIRPLELTFAPYKEKVTIINKFLSDTCDDENITINKIYESYKINKIKLDIEGGEVLALNNASECLIEQGDLELAICAYHNVQDEYEIKKLLSRYGYEANVSSGYMTFMSNDCEPKQFVHGLVKGRRITQNNITSRIVLWGAGKSLESVLSCLKNDNVDLLGVIDANEQKWGEHVARDIVVYSPDILKQVGFDFLIITAKQDKSIRELCAEINISDNKIISFWQDTMVDQAPFDTIFDLTKRKGIVYERLVKCYENRIKNAPYEYGEYIGPKIIESKELLQSIIDCGYSLTRFGDGEYEMMLENERPWFQTPNPRMKAKMEEIIVIDEPELQIAHADNWGNLDKYTEAAADGIREYACARREQLMPILMDNRKHGDTYCTRPWISYLNVDYATEIFDLWKRVWDNRKVVIIEGEFSRIGIGNDLLATAASVRRILCPHKNAFDIYEDILDSVKKYAQMDELILISLGPTATCLVYDLYREGYQCIDIGQIDSEYEWFLRRATERVEVPNKLVAEANGHKFNTNNVFEDVSYNEQIIWSFKNIK